MWKDQPFRKRLYFAWRGLRDAIPTSKSLRTQLWALGCVIVIFALLAASPIWWALLATICGGIIAAELINHGLEHLGDRISMEFDSLIKQAKDCAAGGVLVLCIAALLVFFAFLYERFGTGFASL